MYGANYWKDLDKMLAYIDVLSIHCPYTPETFHLLSKRRLRLLKKNCVVINTSRGEIIDEESLADLLFRKKLGGQGLMYLNMSPKSLKNFLNQIMLFCFLTLVLQQVKVVKQWVKGYLKIFYFLLKVKLSLT